MNKNDKDSLYQKFDAFKLEFEWSKKALLKSKVEGILQAVDTDALEAEDYFMWGLLYYFSDVDDHDNLTIAKDKFQQALLLDSDYYMARLYLAHCHQDEHKWEEALIIYEQVNQERLKTEFPIWRYVKLRKQIGYCYYQAGNQSKAEMYFQEVLQYYRQLPQEELAVPTEMIACLPKQHPITVEIRQIEGY